MKKYFVGAFLSVMVLAFAGAAAAFSGPIHLVVDNQTAGELIVNCATDAQYQTPTVTLSQGKTTVPFNAVSQSNKTDSLYCYVTSQAIQDAFGAYKWFAVRGKLVNEDSQNNVTLMVQKGSDKIHPDLQMTGDIVPFMGVVSVVR